MKSIDDDYDDDSVYVRVFNMLCSGFSLVLCLFCVISSVSIKYSVRDLSSDSA